MEQDINFANLPGIEECFQNYITMLNSLNNLGNHTGTQEAKASIDEHIERVVL